MALTITLGLWCAQGAATPTSAGAATGAGAATSAGGSSTPAAAGRGDAATITGHNSLASSASSSGALSQAAAGSPGYWMVASDGGVYAFGASYVGQMRGQALNGPIVGMAPTPDGRGYWLVGSDGAVFAFGDAVFHGSEGGHHLNRPIVGMASTPDGRGYWLVSSDGGIFTFGDAAFHGSEGGHHLNRPILGMAASPDGRGYWLVASDGGIFTFGDAAFHGSTGAQHLNRPVVGMAATHDGRGYWLVASDGGIFAFGDARFYGSTGAQHLNQPVVAMGVTPSDGGYWLVARDGGLFSFGNAPFHGSTGSNPGPAPIVGMATTAFGFATLVGSTTGYDISWPQCSFAGASTTVALPVATGLSLVGATGGYIGAVAAPGRAYGPNSCLNAEAAWAGPGLQTYLVADPINAADGPLSAATAGPRACPVVADTTACGYNWGWNNALQSVSMVHAHGLAPSKWWLDVELDEGWSPTDTAVSGQIIQGMVDALRSQGLTVGIYCTNYQWGYVTGGLVIPGVLTWIAGAGNLSTGTYSAVAFCTQSGYNFAGGTPYAVQYGYVGSGYSGPPSAFDQDYLCPR